ncbi:MAG: ATPase domain-containing protein [Candidatus Hydrothermarchaeaceae archaeon]
MLETGIPRLDGFLGGGIPEGKTLLYYVNPGVEGKVFIMQSLYHNLQKGRKAVFVTSSVDPKSLRHEFSDFGWDLEEFGDNLVIVDGYSKIMGIDSEEKYVVEDPNSIESLNETLQAAVGGREKVLVAFASLSTVIDMCGEEKTLEYVKKWNKNLMLNDSIGLYNFVAWPYSKETLTRIKEELFNTVIVVKGIAERFIYGQYYGVLKADWTDVSQKYVLFRSLRPGGVKAFIPKLLVTGAFNAGKTTFVHNLSNRAVSVDRLGTTIALDHGHLDHEGFSVDIFGTPGQERFDPILKMLGGEAMGIFLVVDSTKPDHFVRAKEMIELTKGSGLPFIIVANKQDLPDALSIEEIREKMRIGDKIKIIPVVATEKQGLIEAFETLVNIVVEAD